MKRGAGNVVFIAIAIVLAIFVLALGIRILTKAHVGLEKQEEKTQEMKEMLNAQNIYDTCKEWLNGKYYNYRAKAILEDFRLPDLFKPIKPIWECCGEELQRTAVACLPEDSTDPCCNNGYVSVECLQPCMNACRNIIKVYDMCREQCPSKVDLCVTNILSTAYEACRGDMAVPTEMLEDACRGG